MVAALGQTSVTTSFNAKGREADMKPPFAYYGGKVGMAQRIIALMPTHKTYIEPFFGSGAVFFAKPPARHEIINDLNGNVVTFFRVLRERPAELAEACALTPYARAEYEASDLGEDMDDLERARRFWVRVNQSFAKSDGTQTGWSVTSSCSKAPPKTTQTRIKRFRAVADRLAGVSIEQCDAPDLISRLAVADSLVYADPPYLAETRRSGGRQRTADYLHDMGSPADHERLADVLHKTLAVVILSGYPSPLYEDLYSDWWSLDFPVAIHSSNSANGARGARVERVWCNRPLGVGLFAVSSHSASGRDVI
jgi:DNA adenine methylase